MQKKTLWFSDHLGKNQNFVNLNIPIDRECYCDSKYIVKIQKYALSEIKSMGSKKIRNIVLLR